MALVVRPATREELGPIVEIYNHYVRTSPATFDVHEATVGDRAEWFAAHSGGGPHRLLVADDGARGVLGWATTSSFRPRPAYATTVECSVYCRPDAVGQGIGTRLYDALFRSIEQEDLERIVAGVALPNDASLRLHARFGFRPVGVFTRVGRKFGRFWDVAWLERPVRADSLDRVDEGRPVRLQVGGAERAAVPRQERIVLRPPQTEGRGAPPETGGEAPA
jgi:phosphinothricin acetyltransferase